MLRRATTSVTVLQIYSRRCRSCKRVERAYERLGAKYDSQVTCLRFRSESNEEFARDLGVRGFPTFVFYKDGVRVDHFASSSADVLEEAIVDLL